MPTGSFRQAKKKKKNEKKKREKTRKSFPSFLFRGGREGGDGEESVPSQPAEAFSFPPASAGEWRPGRLRQSSLSAAAAGAPGYHPESTSASAVSTSAVSATFY